MNLFDGYDWSGLKIRNVQAVTAKASELLHIDHANLHCYQLGVKFHGLTDIRYNGIPLRFDTGSILYLPRADNADLPYNKYIRKPGTGVCIFFTSDNPLPTQPQIVKDARIPLELFSKIQQTWEQIGEDLACLAAFYQLLAEMKRVTGTAEYSTAQQKLQEARIYIDQHYNAQYIDLDQLAAFCGLSKEYFRQSFQKAYGVTPLLYASGLKIARARELLSESSCSIREAAFLCGFDDANYFSRFFRQHTGMSPTAYRKLYRK